MRHIKLFEEYRTNSEITLEILDNLQLEYILNEEFRYEFYNINNKQRIALDDKYVKKLSKIEETIKTYLKTINPFRVKSFDKNQKQVEIEFEIIPTEHWYSKFVRKEMEDRTGNRGMIDPELYEGIKLIYNNANYLAGQILNGTIREGTKILVKSKDLSKYNMIIHLERVYKNSYRIILKTQMKGVEFHLQPNTKILKLHPNGELKKL